MAAALTKGAEAIVKSDPRMEWIWQREELSADEVPERVKAVLLRVLQKIVEDRYPALSRKKMG